ncbi:MAG: hypothetical protein IKJ57_04375 [Oscillospiraceae bacterium]|nr:hypothetical protein [Oscillospiraceae bacterium]
MFDTPLYNLTVLDFFILFVPGYLFLSVYRKLLPHDSNTDFDNTTVWSLIISILINLTFYCITNSFEEAFSDETTVLLCSAIGVVIGFILSVLVKKEWFRKIMIFFTRLSPRKNIWEEYFDLEIGAFISFETDYYGEPAVVEGIVDSDDGVRGLCDIVIAKFTIKNKDGETLYQSEDKEALYSYFYVNSNNIRNLMIEKGYSNGSWISQKWKAIDEECKKQEKRIENKKRED